MARLQMYCGAVRFPGRLDMGTRATEESEMAPIFWAQTTGRVNLLPTDMGSL